jgi:hypothetical protein
MVVHFDGKDGNLYLSLRTMSHTIYAAKFEQTIIDQHVLLRRESQSYWCSIHNNNIVFAHFNCTSHIYSFYFVILSPGLYVCIAHVLMRFCHLINRSFVSKAQEGRHIRILYNNSITLCFLGVEINTDFLRLLHLRIHSTDHMIHRLRYKHEILNHLQKRPCQVNLFIIFHLRQTKLRRLKYFILYVTSKICGNLLWVCLHDLSVNTMVTDH